MRQLFATLLFGLLLTGPCLDSFASDPAESALQRATEHYRAGKLNEAAGLLRGILVSQADPARRQTALFMLGQVHADLNEPMRSLEYLEQIPTAERGPSELLLEGRMLLHAGQAVRAGQVLAALDPADLLPAERQLRWLSLSDAAHLGDEKQRALYFLFQALQSKGESSRDDILSKVHTLLETEFSEVDLDEVAFMYSGSVIGYQALLKLGWRALNSGQKEQAREWASAVLAAPADFPYRGEALTLLAQLSEAGDVQRAIGVLLPLSGRYAPFGSLVQRGMQLAEQQFRPEIPVRFIYRDTAGTPDTTRNQLEELLFSEQVIAVAGPLVGSAAEAAAPITARERVPLLSLSQKEGLAAASSYLFRNALTIRLQVQTLVEAARYDLGLSRFAILFPANRQGELFAEQFRQELAAWGGELVAAQSYAPEQTDFRRQVRLLLGQNPDARDPDPQEGEQKTPPPFEALFIPDYAERISLIAPQLAFYGLEPVQLLGTNGWNDPEALRPAGRFIEGAIFTDGFFRHSPYPFVQEFVERYFSLYGQDPTILEAQGYDTAGILLTLLNRPDVQTREDLHQALLTMDNFPGVTGATRFDAEGEADKVLFLLQIRDGTIAQRN
ncbi:MAG: penicillin-binding protein activator [Desulfuromonadales bacterium]|nr:penicillin-binding protein activator [Desulfuromonadales bacterium]